MKSQKYLKIWIIIAMGTTIIFLVNSNSLALYMLTGIIAGLSWVITALHFINVINYIERNAKQKKRTQY